MDWNIVSAIGTTIAAFVGITGIWLNIYDKKKKLDVHFEMIPSPKIYLSNNSTRSVTIIKMIYSVNNHVFHIEYFEGLHELVLLPSTTQTMSLTKKDIFDSYYRHQMDSLCDPNKKINIVLKEKQM